MEVIERAFREFSQNDGISMLQKNKKLKTEIQSIIDRPKEEHFRELYKMNCTFGLTAVITHDRVVEIIAEHISNGDWYEKNNFPQVAQAVYDYLISFIFFSSAAPLNIKEALQLYFEITEEEYFKALGFSSSFFSKDGTPNKEEIGSRLERIQSAHTENYPSAIFYTTMLDYSNSAAFARTFLLMIGELDMTRNI
jgi:hypothetical protein